MSRLLHPGDRSGLYYVQINSMKTGAFSIEKRHQAYFTTPKKHIIMDSLGLDTVIRPGWSGQGQQPVDLLPRRAHSTASLL